MEFKQNLKLIKGREFNLQLKLRIALDLRLN